MMMSLKRTAVSIVLLAVVAALLPTIMKYAGIHPECPEHNFSFPNRKALIISTSTTKLGNTQIPTGVYLSELTAPYYEFLAADMTVDIASVKGGEVPIDWVSFLKATKSSCTYRYESDEVLQQKMQNSLRIDDVDFASYDIIFLAGGWGAAFDLIQSEVLAKKVEEANNAGKILGGVCHGPLGLGSAKLPNGDYLVKGRNIAAVSNKQLYELGVAFLTDTHPETALRERGANVEINSGIVDLFQTLVVVDGNIVTGQNQNSGCATAQAMLDIISKLE